MTQKQSLRSSAQWLLIAPLAASFAVGCADRRLAGTNAAGIPGDGADSGMVAGAGGAVGAGGAGGKTTALGSGGARTCEATASARELAEEQGSPLHIAVDATSIYWTGFRLDPADWVVMKVARDGGPPQFLARWYGPAASTIAVDAENVCFGAPKAIQKVPVGGGTVETLVDVAAGPTPIAVDADSVFFTNADALLRVPRGGGTITELATKQDGLGHIAVDATSVYFTAASSVKKVPIGGGTVTELVSGEATPTSIAVDATSVYFTTASLVKKVPIGGGASTTLATAQSAPSAVTVDSANVYWGTDLAPTNLLCYPLNCVESTLMKVPLAGGTPTCALSLGQLAQDFALDGSAVFSVRAGQGSGYAFVSMLVETNTLK